MPKFDEHALEMSIMKLFEKEGYTYVHGDKIQRSNKTQVLIEEDLREYLKTRYASDGLTKSEIDSIILSLHAVSGTLYEDNKQILQKIADGFIFNREDRSKKDLYIELLDYEPDADRNQNIYKIVNQFEIEGYNNQLRIPDGIVFVNGIPLVVLEFKSAIKENTTIMDAFTQLTVRYQRDIPEIFKYNAFVVICDGANSKYGSLFSPYDFFYAWRKVEDNDPEMDGINSLYTMVNGLFRKTRLLDVVKNFIYFPDTSNNSIKVVCRYPQYFAANNLYENVKTHIRPEGDGKGGTYFGTTGCGKSYTMLFLSRLLMKSSFFKSPTIVVITDRTDLDDQLAGQFLASKQFLGDENVVSIDSREMLRKELQNKPSGGIYLTTIQKFTENLELLTDRSNVICISDEAHRTQVNLDMKVRVTDKGVSRSFGFAKYLHDSLPNATYVGFTGTPIDATIDVFGAIVGHPYTMTEAVKDGITVNLVYDGRAARVTLDSEKVKEIEDYYDRCADLGATEEQIEESQKAVAHIDAIIGDPDRLQAVAKDFVSHYENRVEEGASVAGKAMFVCSNRNIAYRFYQYVIRLRPEWAEKKKAADGVELTEKDEKELKPIEKIKLVMTRNKDDEKALYDMLGTKDDRKEFDRQFKNVKSNFKIAIVVDMWLTGFDVPALDTIYIDKPIQQHTLIQTISRVNRVYEGKDKGLIVDYIGIKKNMNLALRKYTNFEKEEFENIDQAVTLVKDTLEVLDAMFHNFNAHDYFEGDPLEQLNCLNRAVEYVQLTEEMETRFMAAVRKMKQSYNLCSGSDAFTDKEIERIHFYQAVRSVLFKLTKGEAPDIAQMNAKVRKLLEGAIQSDGIEELFETGKHIDIDIFSDEYLLRIEKITLPNTKIKALQRLLAYAIDEFRKVNKIKSIEFDERMKAVVDMYNNRRRDEAFANEVLDDVAEQLAQLLHELKTEKNSFEEMGIDYEEKAFYDILFAVAKKYEFEYPEDKMIALSKEIKVVVDDKAKYTDFSTREDIKASLQVDLIVLLDKYGYPPVTIDDVYKEVLEQAENFKKYS
ncbi:MAG: type I restriction endonuclease subunit R [Lachnospiraceae bacterium]|nr:type I restriction endonuclease subunit R [Lachnospiraceae bacterium]